MDKTTSGVPNWKSNEARDAAIEARKNFQNYKKELQSTKLAYFQLKEQWAVDRNQKIEE